MKQKSQVINRSIIKSASSIFSKYGYEKATMSEIAKEASVATGTIYIYFKNKEELLNQIYQGWKKRQYDYIMQGFPSGGAPRVQFQHLWTRSINFGKENIDGVKFIETHYQAPYLNEESISLWKNVNRDIISIVKQAQELKFLKSINPQVLISMLNGAINALITDCKLTPELISETEQCMWEAIRG